MNAAHGAWAASFLCANVLLTPAVPLSAAEVKEAPSTAAAGAAAAVRAEPAVGAEPSASGSLETRQRIGKRKKQKILVELGTGVGVYSNQYVMDDAFAVMPRSNVSVTVLDTFVFSTTFSADFMANDQSDQSDSPTDGASEDAEENDSSESEEKSSYRTRFGGWTVEPNIAVIFRGGAFRIIPSIGAYIGMGEDERRRLSISATVTRLSDPVALSVSPSAAFDLSSGLHGFTAACGASVMEAFNDRVSASVGFQGNASAGSAIDRGRLLAGDISLAFSAELNLDDSKRGASFSMSVPLGEPFAAPTVSLGYTFRFSDGL